jgi:stress response protein SCP2
VPTELSKGANAPVPTAELTVEVSWQAAPGMDLDASALLLTDAGKVRSDDDFIFYNQPASADGSVKHAGSLPGGGDRIVVDAGRVPDSIDKVAFTASIHDADAKGQTFAHVNDARIAVLQGGQPVVSFAIGGLTTETGLVFGELYRRQGAWKFRAVGQGYSSGLKGIATEFGISVDDEPAAAPPPPPPAVDMHKQRAVDLRKKVETSSPVLLKKFDAAQVSLEKKGLLSERAEVLLVLDVSGSSRSLFRSGAYQELIDRFVAAALLFDDNGTLDTWLFDHRLHEAESITMANREGWTDRQLQRKDIWGMTEYAKPIDKIADGLQRGSRMPTYVAFITDGANHDKRDTTKAIQRASGLPAFFQFMAIGKANDFPFLQRLDELTGREIDNAGFFALTDPKRISDDEFYDKVMIEFPAWLTAARRAGILAS